MTDTTNSDLRTDGVNLFMQIVFSRETALGRSLTELFLQLAALLLLQFLILIPYAARRCCTAASRITFFSATFMFCTGTEKRITRSVRLGPRAVRVTSAEVFVPKFRR